MPPNEAGGLVRALYRSLLRWTRLPDVARTKFVLPVLDESLARRWPNEGVRNADGVRRALRVEFRARPPDPGVLGTEAWQTAQLQDGFTLLKQLQDFTVQIDDILRLRKENAAEVDFALGEVLRHKRFGYRCIVFGWDKQPALDVSGWDGMRGVSTKQPFYHVLPDSTDSVAFLASQGAHRRYVAQSNLERSVTPAERRLVNPLASEYFERFDAGSSSSSTCQLAGENARFVVTEEHGFLYPTMREFTASQSAPPPRLIDDHRRSSTTAAGAAANDKLTPAAVVAARARVNAAAAAVAAAAIDVMGQRGRSEAVAVRGEAGRNVLAEDRKLLLRQFPPPPRAAAGEEEGASEGHDWWVEEGAGQSGLVDQANMLVVNERVATPPAAADLAAEQALSKRLWRLHNLLNRQAAMSRKRSMRTQAVAKEAGVLYEMGQVLRHAKWGYRGVIMGASACKDKRAQKM